MQISSTRTEVRRIACLTLIASLGSSSLVWTAERHEAKAVAPAAPVARTVAPLTVDTTRHRPNSAIALGGRGGNQHAGVTILGGPAVQNKPTRKPR